MNADTINYIPIWKCKACGPDISMLAVVTQSSRLVGTQQTITLHGDSHAELVKALRVHPKYEGRGMKELLAIVRKSASNSLELPLKLSKKLVPTFCAVLQNEGIGVRVSAFSA